MSMIPPGCGYGCVLAFCCYKAIGRLREGVCESRVGLVKCVPLADRCGTVEACSYTVRAGYTV